MSSMFACTKFRHYLRVKPLSGPVIRSILVLHHSCALLVPPAVFDQLQPYLHVRIDHIAFFSTQLTQNWVVSTIVCGSS